MKVNIMVEIGKVKTECDFLGRENAVKFKGRVMIIKVWIRFVMGAVAFF